MGNKTIRGNRLIEERKVLPNNGRGKFKKTTHRGNDEYRLNVTGEAGNEFQVIVRMSVFNKLNFSVIIKASLKLQQTKSPMARTCPEQIGA